MTPQPQLRRQTAAQEPVLLLPAGQYRKCQRGGDWTQAGCYGNRSEGHKGCMYSIPSHPASSTIHPCIHHAGVATSSSSVGATPSGVTPKTQVAPPSICCSICSRQKSACQTCSAAREAHMCTHTCADSHNPELPVLESRTHTWRSLWPPEPSRRPTGTRVLTSPSDGVGFSRIRRLVKYLRGKRAVGEGKSGPAPTWREK